MKKILVTTDLSEEAKVAFEVASSFASVFGASVHLLTVVEDPQQAAMVYAMEFPVFPDSDIQKQLVEKVESELSKIATTQFSDVSVETFVREASGPVHREIIDFANQQGIELIIIATHGRTGFKHLLIGSIAERVARESACPVLVVPVKRSDR